MMKFIKQEQSYVFFSLMSCANTEKVFYNIFNDF